jgi:hypothetical protein
MGDCLAFPARSHNISLIMNYRCGILWLFLFALMAWTGCATNKIDWGARVGTYTHDQAIVDLGPPDKQEKLTDGTVVAEWLIQRGRTAYVGGAGYYGYPGSRGYYGPTYIQSSPDYFLRLTFAPDGKLTGWKKFAR